MADAEVVHRNTLECGCVEFWYKNDAPNCETPPAYGYGLGINMNCPQHKHWLVNLNNEGEQGAAG